MESIKMNKDEKELGVAIVLGVLFGTAIDNIGLGICLGLAFGIALETKKSLKEDEKMSYDEWYEVNEEEINIELAESGADREMDFDCERAFEDRYENYINHTK